ncbi:MAG: type II toxin-antitoxin system RelE/ParE family toxin [Egibacteraceae bacterium]
MIERQPRASHDGDVEVVGQGREQVAEADLGPADPLRVGVQGDPSHGASHSELTAAATARPRRRRRCSWRGRRRHIGRCTSRAGWPCCVGHGPGRAAASRGCGWVTGQASRRPNRPDTVSSNRHTVGVPTAAATPTRPCRRRSSLFRDHCGNDIFAVHDEGADWLDALSEAAYERVATRIDELAAQGQRLRMPRSRALGDGLFELRISLGHVLVCARPEGGAAHDLHQAADERTA